MIYIFIVAAIVIITLMNSAASAPFSPRRRRHSTPRIAAGAAAAPAVKVTAGLTLAPAQVAPYITLAIGSAMALFMYPHAMTSTLAASSGRAIRFNAMALPPAYSFVLGLIALLGMMALAAGIRVASPATDAVPQLVLWAFPDWFAGFCFAAIALGALVPAAVMSMGEAGIRSRATSGSRSSIPKMTPREESVVAKLVSLIVKVGALLVIFFMPTQFALDLQLLGGVLDGADLPGDDPGSVHPLVQRFGAADRLGRGHDRGHVAGLGRKSLDAAPCPEVGRPAARQFRSRLFRLQRSDLGDRQFRRRGRALARPAPTPRATKPRRAITRIVGRLSPCLLSARSRYEGSEMGGVDADAFQIDNFSEQNAEMRTCRDGILLSLPDTLTRLYTLLT